MKRLNIMYSAVLKLAVPLMCVLCASCTDDIDLKLEQQRSGFTIVGEPVEISLSIAVSDLTANVATRAEDPLEYNVEDTEEERHIDDLWIFEYDQSSGKLVYTPTQVSIKDQSELDHIEVTLSDNYGRNVVLYVVANSGSGVSDNSKEWVSYNSTTGTYDGFMTLEELEKKAIPTPHPQRMTWDETKQKYVIHTDDANVVGSISIPMSGYLKGITIEEDADILVPVERMFAKVLVRVDLSDFSEDYESAWLNTVTIGNIPEYSTVGALGNSQTTQPADYSGCEQWLQRRFNSVGESSSDTGSDPSGGSVDAVYPYLIYVPENIQGENQVDDSTDKADNVPNSYALSVTAGIYVIENGSTIGEYTSFIAYPGGNTTTNFNVRRNCIYRVTLKINNLIDEVLPSANCIICLSGETTAFYPYCRTETGGGYDFEDYLYSGDDDAKKGQKISYVKIIWQSTDGGNTVNYSSSATGYIGDNTKGDLVWIDNLEDVKDEYHRRIHVTIPEDHTGNALIGAYNSDEEIIWSWHIWSRKRSNDPTTVNTKLYYTYEWDENGIYGKDSGHPRMAGYTIMNCNLGAMQDEPNYSSSNVSFSNACLTFGTLYQWGRKDPFPPISVYPGSTDDSKAIKSYDETQTGNYFDNENNKVTIVNTNESSALFHSVGGTDRKEFDEMIPLTIQNPTVFYAGTKDVNKQDVYYIAFMTASSVTNFNANYPEPCDGNWMLDSEDDHFNRLWGGLDPEKDTLQIKKSYFTGLVDALGDDVHVYDDYGEKSIFDPCPYGWRVSPPDLWLGFTSTGLNPSALSEINYNTSSSYSGQYGYTMYMTAWREDETSFFPTQGVRTPDGCAFKAGCCGNYNNATADVGDRVNVLHVHNSYSNFNIFEVKLLPYHIKSSANSLRCVRIDSVKQ